MTLNSNWIYLAFIGIRSIAFAEPAGAPGIPYQWTAPLKQAIGTTYEQTAASSPVWFTVSEGILTEVYYPRVDEAQVGYLEFIVTDGESFISQQRRDTFSQVSFGPQSKNGGMSVRIEGNDRTDAYTFSEEIVSDTASPVVRIHFNFHMNRSGLKLFVLFKPTLNNSASSNIGLTHPEALVATHLGSQNPTYAALVSSTGWSAQSSGYVGFSDGLEDLSHNFHLTQFWNQVGPGNIALTGEIPLNSANDIEFDLALGFGNSQDAAQISADISLQTDFDHVRTQYNQSWENYLLHLQNSPRHPKVLHSTQMIKMYEDKLQRGMLTSPQGRISPRDIYAAATALLAAGDQTTPIQALRYINSIQKPDGSWPKNSGILSGLELDQVSSPILLAALLQKKGGYVLTREDLEMIRKATTFLLSHGPITPQDRWGEAGGFNPYTLATEIAALRLAGELIHDPEVNRIAELWQASLETWTLVRSSPLGENFYSRKNGSRLSQDLELSEINPSPTSHPLEEVDGGFLNLVRMGIRPALDPRILTTLKIYENTQELVASVPSASVDAKIYRRFPKDTFGASRIGGYWPLLAGEKGLYSVAAKDFETAKVQLRVMEESLTPQGLFPEQLIAPPSDLLRVGAGTVCPSIHTHAEFILLFRSIEEGVVFDTPLY